MEQGLGGILSGGAGVPSMEQVSAFLELDWCAKQDSGLVVCGFWASCQR